MDKVIVIIPAYNPNEKLIELVEKIDNEIIIINDGTLKEREYIFKKLAPSVIILNNKLNKGKGYSLKKGFKYVEDNLQEDIIGIVTADADGQHTVEDVKKIIYRLKENFDKKSEKIILGSRDFNQKGIPVKSKIGNIVISYLFQKKSGIYLKDTQTGLRGIPITYLKQLINIEGSRFEYEQNMLKYIIKEKIKLEELKIKTVYNKSNKTNFKICSDSYKIIKSIFN